MQPVEKPGFGELPIALEGRDRDPHRLRRLALRESGEVTQLHDAAGARFQPSRVATAPPRARGGPRRVRPPPRRHRSARVGGVRRDASSRYARARSRRGCVASHGRRRQKSGRAPASRRCSSRTTGRTPRESAPWSARYGRAVPVETPTRSTSETIADFHADLRHGGDLSRADLAYAGNTARIDDYLRRMLVKPAERITNTAAQGRSCAATNSRESPTILLTRAERGEACERSAALQPRDDAGGHDEICHHAGTRS